MVGVLFCGMISKDNMTFIANHIVDHLLNISNKPVVSALRLIFFSPYICIYNVVGHSKQWE